MNERGSTSTTFRISKDDDYKRFRAMLLVDNLKVGDLLNQFISEFVRNEDFRTFIRKTLIKKE